MTAIDARYKPKIRKVKSKVYWWPVDWDKNTALCMLVDKKLANKVFGKVVKVMVMEVE